MHKKIAIVKDDFFIYSDTPDEAVLREDMYQATYDQYIIDCGWYENAEEGSFITYLIKDYEWDMPVFKIFTKDFENAKRSVYICEEYLMKIT